MITIFASYHPSKRGNTEKRGLRKQKQSNDTEEIEGEKILCLPNADLKVSLLN